MSGKPGGIKEPMWSRSLDEKVQISASAKPESREKTVSTKSGGKGETKSMKA